MRFALEIADHQKAAKFAQQNGDELIGVVTGLAFTGRSDTDAIAKTLQKYDSGLILYQSTNPEKTQFEEVRP